MKLALITDIHFSGVGPDRFDTRPLVEEFVDWARRMEVDLLLDLGDRIDDIDRPTDLANAAELARIFERFPGQRVHLQGNHDVVNITGEDHSVLFGTPPGHRAIDLGPVRLLVWQPSVLLDRQVGFPAAAAEAAWLAAALAGDERPALIASHIPVSGAAMTSNYYFENNADFATYPDHADIRETIEASGRAAVWLSGHVHWNSIAEVAGVRHLTVQSASERFTTMPEPACAYALLEIENARARLEVFGRDPVIWEFPFAASGQRRWPSPRPRVSRP
jgi:Icc protein